MKTLIKFIIIITISFCLSACTRQIKGDEKEVKDLVIQLCQEQLRNNLVPELITSKYHTAPYIWGNPTYKELKEISEDNRANNIISIIDSIMSVLNMTVEDIRVTEKNRDVNKVKCSAVIYMNGEESIDIKYSAQLTTDNEKVYVELIDFNLK